MGRPKKSDPRDRQLNISLTAAEYERIAQRAKALGMRPVHLGRARLLDWESPTPSRPSPSNIEKLNYSALVSMGRDLNQMLRHLRQTGKPVPVDLEPLLTDIRQFLACGVSK